MKRIDPIPTATTNIKVLIYKINELISAHNSQLETDPAQGRCADKELLVQHAKDTELIGKLMIDLQEERERAKGLVEALEDIARGKLHSGDFEVYAVSKAKNTIANYKRGGVCKN